MTSMELVPVPKHLPVIVPEGSRRERRLREKRTRRKWIGGTALGCFALFGVTFPIALTVTNQPPAVASAQETVQTTVPAPTTTWPEPEPAPTTSQPGWQKPAIAFLDGTVLGHLLTDDVIPGDVGSAIVSINHDMPGVGAVIVVDGIAWRVTRAATVKPENLNPLIRRTTVPLLFLVSEKAVPDRPYVEMEQK